MRPALHGRDRTSVVRRVRPLHVELVLPPEDVPLERVDRERAELLALEQLHDGAEALRFQPVRDRVVEDQLRDFGQRAPWSASAGFGQRGAVGDSCASYFLAAAADVLIFGGLRYMSNLTKPGEPLYRDLPSRSAWTKTSPAVAANDPGPMAIR